MTARPRSQAGATAGAGGGGPWRQPVAGGQHIIELERQR